MPTPLRILILEDSEDDAALLLRALRRGGYEPDYERVDTAEAMRAALDRDEWDVVIADYSMPRFSAPAALAILQERGLDPPLVVFSGSIGEAAAVELMRGGAYDYVMKDRPGRVVTAVEHALRERAARRERRRAEEALRLLSGAGALLASSLDYEATLQAVARLAASSLADYCVIDTMEPSGTLRRLAVAHRDPEQEPLAQELRRFLPDPRGPHPLFDVLRSGEPRLIADLDEGFPARVASGPEHLAALRALRPTSYMAVPLTARGRRLGVLTFAATHDRRRYGPEDMALAGELAGRCALAIDNAGLYREARDAIRLRDEFLSVAAHELKTPITSLKGMAQLALRRLDRRGHLDPRQVSQTLETIERQSDKLTRLISQLLDVSRIEAGQLAIDPQAVDLRQVVADAVVVAQAWTTKHEFAFAAPSAVEARVDPLRIEQVLMNLLTNAVRYSPQGGRVDVTLFQVDAGAARVEVRDRGLGIPPEHRDRIFDRFFRAHPGSHLEGIGLGLYISRQIVELHGGRIKVDFPDDGGTRVIVTLPTRPDHAANGLEG